MRKKNRKKLIILAVAIVLAILAVVLVLRQGEQAPESVRDPGETEKIPLTDSKLPQSESEPDSPEVSVPTEKNNVLASVRSFVEDLFSGWGSSSKPHKPWHTEDPDEPDDPDDPDEPEEPEEPEDPEDPEDPEEPVEPVVPVEPEEPEVPEESGEPDDPEEPTQEWTRDPFESIRIEI